MKQRKALKITSRTSSITNSFVQSIIPSIPATTAEEDEALSFLGMTRENKECIYCGSGATDWDHLRPLVRNRRPTGYVDDVRNRVPSCNRCNQSKSGADWHVWMVGKAVGSPSMRNPPVRDLERRIERLRAFEAWGSVQPFPIAESIDPALWEMHWANHDQVIAKMRDSQTVADKLKLALVDAWKRAQIPPP